MVLCYSSPTKLIRSTVTHPFHFRFLQPAFILVLLHFCFPVSLIHPPVRLYPPSPCLPQVHYGLWTWLMSPRTKRTLNPLPSLANREVTQGSDYLHVLIWLPLGGTVARLPETAAGNLKSQGRSLQYHLWELREQQACPGLCVNWPRHLFSLRSISKSTLGAF